MGIVIEFDTGNDAFYHSDGTFCHDEVCRILEVIKGKVAAGQEGGKIKDYNGNYVGDWSADFDDLEKDDEDE